MLMRPRPAAFRCTVEQLDSFLTLGLLLNVLKSFQVIVNFALEHKTYFRLLVGEA